MTNSTTTGRGRPAIGPRTYVRLEQEVMDELDAWAAERGMKRAEAIRHLVVTGMRIGDATEVMRTVGRRTVESLFPEAEGDATETWDLAHGEETGSFGAIESHPDRPYTVTIGAIRARGHWLVTEERFEGDAWQDAVQTMTVAADEAEAVRIYRKRVAELTDQLWTDGDEAPLWWEGVDGDRLGYGDAVKVTWPGLLPAAAVGAE